MIIAVMEKGKTMSNYIKRSDLLRIMKERKQPERYSQRHIQWLTDWFAILNAPSVDPKELAEYVKKTVKEN